MFIYSSPSCVCHQLGATKYQHLGSKVANQVICPILGFCFNSYIKRTKDTLFITIIYMAVNHQLKFTDRDGPVQSRDQGWEMPVYMIWVQGKIVKGVVSF